MEAIIIEHLQTGQKSLKNHKIPALKDKISFKNDDAFDSLIKLIIQIFLSIQPNSKLDQ